MRTFRILLLSNSRLYGKRAFHRILPFLLLFVLRLDELHKKVRKIQC